MGGSFPLFSLLRPLTSMGLRPYPLPCMFRAMFSPSDVGLPGLFSLACFLLICGFFASLCVYFLPLFPACFLLLHGLCRSPASCLPLGVGAGCAPLGAAGCPASPSPSFLSAHLCTRVHPRPILPGWGLGWVPPVLVCLVLSLPLSRVRGAGGRARGTHPGGEAKPGPGKTPIQGQGRQGVPRK